MNKSFVKQKTVRDSIMSIIEANPGIQSAEIRKRSMRGGEFDRCVIAHCLTRLWRHARVDRDRVAGAIAKTYAYSARNNLSRKDQILEIIKRQPGIKVQQVVDMASEAGLNPNSVPGTMSELAKAGLVIRAKRDASDDGSNERTYRYWPLGDCDSPNGAGEREPHFSMARSCEYLGLKESQLWGYTSHGMITPVMLDGERQFAVTELDALRAEIGNKKKRKPSEKASIATEPAQQIVSARDLHNSGLDRFEQGVNLAAMICEASAGSPSVTQESSAALLACAIRIRALTT